MVNYILCIVILSYVWNSKKMNLLQSHEKDYYYVLLYSGVIAPRVTTTFDFPQIRALKPYKHYLLIFCYIRLNKN